MPALDPFLQRLSHTAESQLAAIRGRTVLVGLSGGADSTALLYALHQRRDALDIQLHAAHFDHGLRRHSESESIALYSWTNALGVPLTRGGKDVGSLARDLRQSLETAARFARYEFLTATARSLGAVIVVGHNQNDQAETVLLNLARGAGVTGVAGMRPVTTAPSAPDIVLVRPLLSLTAAEVRTYCARNDLPVIEDPSNLSEDYARNRVRHVVVPALEGVNAGSVGHLADAAEALRGDEEALDVFGAELYGLVAECFPGTVFLDVLTLATAPRAVQLRALRIAVRHVAGTLDRLERVHLLGLLALAGKRVGGRTLHLPSGLRAVRRGDRLVLWSGDLPEHLLYQLPLVEDADGEPARLTAGWVWTALPGRCERPAEEPGRALHEHVRYTEDTPILRAARRGEKFWPLGMPYRKPVADFLADRKVPPALRNRVPLLTVAGEAAWLVGWRIDDRWKLLRPDDPYTCLTCTRSIQSP